MKNIVIGTAGHEANMREKEDKILITFKSFTDAVAFEKALKGREIPGRLVPVPREISASCGQCWISPVVWESRVQEIISEDGLSVEDQYHMKMV